MPSSVRTFDNPQSQLRIRQPSHGQISRFLGVIRSISKPAGEQIMGTALGWYWKGTTGLATWALGRREMGEMIVRTTQVDATVCIRTWDRTAQKVGTSDGLPRDAKKVMENKTRRAKSLGRVYYMNREAGHITDFEQIDGGPDALAIAALPANMVLPCSQIAREQTIMRRERFWLQLEAQVLHLTGMKAASHVVSAAGSPNVMFQSVGDPLGRSAGRQRTSQDDLPTARAGGAGEPGKREEAWGSVSLGTVPPLAASDTAKRPLPVAAGPRSQVLSPPKSTPGQGKLAAQGDGPPLNKAPSTAVPRILRVIGVEVTGLVFEVSEGRNTSGCD